MLNMVLLSGHLNEERLRQATREIQEVASGFERTFNLVINSKGGDMKPTLDFISFLRTLFGHYQKRSGRKKVELPAIKIYNAESAAALISLAMPTYREMQRDGELGIHCGSVILEASEFNLEDGKVSNEETLSRFQRHAAYLKEILSESGLASDSKSMAELYGSNWLRLSADECLKRGLVQRLF